MRTIPRRTDPLTRATMPAITSTAAMTHRMVSVLPPPFAASIPRAPSMSPPFILGNNTGGAARSLTQRGRPAPGRWPGCSPLGFRPVPEAEKQGLLAAIVARKPEVVNPWGSLPHRYDV
jgi:hypothetical protein